MQYKHIPKVFSLANMINKFFSFLKIIIINFFILLIFLIVADLIFGNWFNNNFKTRLSSERNVNRVYKFDFENYKGSSHYIRDNLGFRINKRAISPEEVEVVFAGGSTTNQKFLNYDDTLVALLQKKFKNIKFVNAGIDGMSIVGHINSFEYWFDKIKNFSPDYYIFYIGLNDRTLFPINKIRPVVYFDESDFINKIKRPVDYFDESDFINKIKEYLEANSFIYNKIRIIKSILYLKFGLNIGSNIINSKTFVYGEQGRETESQIYALHKLEGSQLLEFDVKKIMYYLRYFSNVRDKNNFENYLKSINQKWFKKYIYTGNYFVTYEEFRKNYYLDYSKEKKYLELLNKLTNKVKSRNAEPIFITQISNEKLHKDFFLISETIMKHCKNKNLFCINMASEKNLNSMTRELKLDYKDFFDGIHLKPIGSKKVSEYIFKKLSVEFNKKYLRYEN